MWGGTAAAKQSAPSMAELAETGGRRGGRETTAGALEDAVAGVVTPVDWAAGLGVEVADSEGGAAGGVEGLAAKVELGGMYSCL